MKKTVREWILEFPEPWKTEILGEAEKQGFADFETKVSSPCEALQFSMYYSKTKRGDNGWFEIYTQLRDDPKYLHKQSSPAEKTRKTPTKVIDWIPMFPEPWRSAIAINHSKFRNTCCHDQDHCANAGNAINDLMHWKQTPQGWNYWDNLSRKLGGITTEDEIKEICSEHPLPNDEGKGLSEKTKKTTEFKNTPEPENTPKIKKPEVIYIDVSEEEKDAPTVNTTRKGGVLTTTIEL